MFLLCVFIIFWGPKCKISLISLKYTKTFSVGLLSKVIFAFLLGLATSRVDVLVDKQTHWVQARTVTFFLFLLALFFLLVRKIPVFLLQELVLIGPPGYWVLYSFAYAFDLIIHDLRMVGLEGHFFYARQQWGAILRFAQVNQDMALPDQRFFVLRINLEDLVDHVAGLGKALLTCLAQLDEAQTHVIQNWQL